MSERSAQEFGRSKDCRVFGCAKEAVIPEGYCDEHRAWAFRPPKDDPLPSQSAAEPNALRALRPRELEILTLVAAGLRNAEIGERLFISEETVKSHLRTVYKVIRANGRSHAIAIGFREGWLE